jgi:patatin-like phospholipase/acyl hydrolase
MEDEKKLLRILCLDGGGSKGMYTLGVLSETEAVLGKKLHEQFDLIFGTSTGAIIAALLGLGYSVKEITEVYKTLVPKIMTSSGKKNKSRALTRHGKELFGDRKFDAFKTGIGIVAMNYETQKPIIFKNTADRAHGSLGSFIPGFGVSILDAVEASCAACPIFCKKVLKTQNKGNIIAIDGGFIANNPSLFALIDGTKALEYSIENIRLLSVGVGNYIEKPLSRKMSWLSKFEMAQIASRVLVASSNTTEVVTKLLFPNLKMARINDSFPEPQHGTNMIEKSKKKLDKMFQLGIGSYAEHEQKILSVIL